MRRCRSHTLLYSKAWMTVHTFTLSANISMKPNQTMSTSTRGVLIVIEGLDRAGKSTQCERLCKRLEQQGRPVRSLKFPSKPLPTSRHWTNRGFDRAWIRSFDNYWLLYRCLSAQRIRTWRSLHTPSFLCQPLGGCRIHTCWHWRWHHTCCGSLLLLWYCLLSCQAPCRN